MELTWYTFFLEIINFLILVWILKRFLYKPVMDAIAKRRASIEQSMQEAAAKEQAAQTLKGQYENRLADWGQERQQAREQLQKEIEQERQHLQQQLHTAIQQDQEKAKVIAQQEQQEMQRRNEQQALQNSMRFTSKLLSALASAELESRLLTRLLDELKALTPAQRTRLSHSLNEHELTAKVQTAFPLPDAQRQALQQVLQTISSREITCQYEQDTTLLAGARIQLGPWLLHANLQDELQSFAEFEHNFSEPVPHE